MELLMFADKNETRAMLTGTGTRATLEKRLQNLQTQVLTLGSLVSEAILHATNILKKRDAAAAKSLILADQDINQRRIDIQRNCLRIIATQNPIAGDLRFISACLEIASELERMHDYAKGIAKVTLLIGEESETKLPPELPLMAQEAKNMLHLALDALIQHDVDLALSVASADAKIDKMYEQLYSDLIGSSQTHLPLSNYAHHLLWVAHNLERAGDRVTNICEWVVYIATGKRVEMNADNDIPLIEYR
jgi:phosphate transport system protein